MKHVEQLIEEARRECLLLTDRANKNDPELDEVAFLLGALGELSLR
jgi:hypothetical protein